MALYAGFWGPEMIVWSTSGTPARDTPVTVLEAATGLPTTLYADETKAVTVANPVKTDERGNLSFFAAPGKYKLRWDGVVQDLSVVVEDHPNDPAGGGGGVTDHGLLAGLTDDDHAQYHNNARGDARYYTQTQVDSALGGKANSSHTHPSSQITDFATAVDSRIQNVVGAAPAALDTLDELAAALGDDANFAATVTSLLAAKAPLASPAFTGTPTGITKAHVGLGNVDNTSDLGKPISTAVQAALDGKAALSHNHLLERLAAAFGARGLSGHPFSFTSGATPGATDHLLSLVVGVPGETVTAVKVVSAAAATFSASGTPAQCKVHDFSGALLGTSPNDAALWGAGGVRTCTFSVPFTVPSDGLMYVGFSFGGFTGVNLPCPPGMSNSLLGALTGGKRLGIFGTDAAGIPSAFNPATYGVGPTNWIPFIMVVSS